MDQYLTDRFQITNPSITGLPTVQEVSAYLEVSPRYLSDMLKSLTGQSAQQHIHGRLIESAKAILSNTQWGIADIAYQLGFEHPQSFNKLFKKNTHKTPTEFRKSFN